MIFSVENIGRLGAMMFQTSGNSQLRIDLQYSSQQLAIVQSLMHQTYSPGQGLLNLVVLVQGKGAFTNYVCIFWHFLTMYDVRP